MKLVVGLGNPGKEYDHTRHNVGFRILDALCSDWVTMPKCSSLICKTEDIIYAKPQTFMNLSGKAVQELIQFYKIEMADMLVVYDDKDLPFGKLRLRTEGSSAGHNGMNSIIGMLGTQEFSRLRIGVAPADPEVSMHDTADYVLANFTAEEETNVQPIIDEARKTIESFIHN